MAEKRFSLWRLFSLSFTSHGYLEGILNSFFWLLPLFLFFNTQTMHIKSIVHNSIDKKPYTLAEFEPGSAGSEANAVSTSPRRQG
jgi:hypothetical protein